MEKSLSKSNGVSDVMNRFKKIQTRLRDGVSKPVIATVTCLFLGVGAFAEGNATTDIKGNSNTAMGNYVITELPVEKLGDETVRKFELKYEKAQNPIYIYLVNKPKFKDYIVRANDVEVKYVCKKSGFGAERIYGKFAKFNPEINAMFLIEESLEQQQKIAAESVSEDTALGLVACFFPKLVKHPEFL